MFRKPWIKIYNAAPRYICRTLAGFCHCLGSLLLFSLGFLLCLLTHSETLNWDKAFVCKCMSMQKYGKNVNSAKLLRWIRSHKLDNLRIWDRCFVARGTKLKHIPFWFCLSVVLSPPLLLLATLHFLPLGWVCCLLHCCLLKAEIERLVCQILIILCKYRFTYCR